MPVQVAKWDSARDAWMDEGRISLFSELSDAFLETFPTSGMTVNGVAYELPTWEPATDGSASSSLLPTVTTQDGANNGGPSQFYRNTPPLNTRVLMLPTPTVGMMLGGSETRSGARSGEKLLPTPVAQPSGNTPENHLRKKPGRQVVTDLAILVENDLMESGGKLLQTPSVADAQGGHERRGGKRSEELLLNGQVKALLPTPMTAYSSRDAETWLQQRPAGNGQRRTIISDLRIVTEEVLPTGESTSQLSDAGKLDSDGQLPGQLNLLDAMADTD